jgi:ubiquinone/menaquinone biosynthesis C-methylase UbiE
MDSDKNVWEKNYKRGRFNRYPFDEVVSFVLGKFKKNKKKIKILDLGCGGGNNTKFLIDENYDTYAVDGSNESIYLTKKILGKKFNKKKILKSNLKNLPYESNKFDCVIDRQSLGQNNITDIKIIIEEVKRVLKNKGIFFSMCYSSNHPHKKFGKILDKKLSLNDVNNFKRGNFKSSDLTHFFQKKEIMNLYSKFKILDIVHQQNRSLIRDISTNYNSNSFIIIVQKL